MAWLETQLKATIAMEPGRLALRELRTAAAVLNAGGLPEGANQESEPMRILSVDIGGNVATFSPELIGTHDARYGDYTFGNIVEQPLDAIVKRALESDLYRDIRRGVAACARQCEWYEFCRGGSPANKLFEHGTFEVAETMCCRHTRKTVLNVVLAEIEARLDRAGHGEMTALPAARMQDFAAVEALVTREKAEITADTPGLTDAAERLQGYNNQDMFDVYLNWLERLRRIDDQFVLSTAAALSLSEPALPAKMSSLIPTLEVAACMHQLAAIDGPIRAACFDAVVRRRKPDVDTSGKPLTKADEAVAEVLSAVKQQEDDFNAKSRRDFDSQTSVYAGDFRKALWLLENKSGVYLPFAVRSRIDEVINDPSKATWSFEETQIVCHGGAQPPEKNADLYRLIDTYLASETGSWRHPPGIPENHVGFHCPREITPLEHARFLSAIINNLQPKDFRSSTCIAAIWLREQAAKHTADAPRNHGAGLEEFFNFSVEMLEDRTCHLVISPKIGTLRSEKPLPPELDDKRCDPNPDHPFALMNHLSCLLEGPGYSDRDNRLYSQSFSYGLSPRLREHVHAQNQRAANASANVLGYSLLFGRTTEVTRDSTDPEVVGFSRPALDGEHAISGARFGWLIAPRADPASSGLSGLPVQQVQLGALLAVPSWWRTALLQICTAAVRRSDIGAVTEAAFWAHAHPDRCHVETLRLPGNASDIARHLGMDVLTYPYILPPTSEDGSPQIPPMIYANDRSRPASILIRGERLWRSTVVALGGQQQDHIQVLPDMSGIIATFRCVDVPTLHNGTSPKSQTPSEPGEDELFADYSLYDVPLSVWTSEGHTEDFRTTVAPAKSEAALKRAQPCHPPASGPSPAKDSVAAANVP